MSAKRSKYFPKNLLFIFLFLASFIIPVLCIELFFGPEYRVRHNVDIEKTLKDAKKLTKNRLKVLNSKDLEPVEGEDFLLTTWFKLLRMPESGERVILFSKYDTKADNTPGYAVAFENISDKIKFLVYFRDGYGKGRWYSLSDISITPKLWYLLVFSYQDNHLLGLHLIDLNSPSGDLIHLIGGYNLKGKILPSSQADLIFGGYGKHIFRGQIGPIGVFSGKDISKDYKKFYIKLLESPDSVPKDLEDNLKFWTKDGIHDQSPAARKIIKILK